MLTPHVLTGEGGPAGRHRGTGCEPGIQARVRPEDVFVSIQIVLLVCFRLQSTPESATEILRSFDARFIDQCLRVPGLSIGD